MPRSWLSDTQANTSTPFLQSALSPGSATSYRQILGRPNAKQGTLLAPSPLPLYLALLSTSSALFPRRGQGNGVSLCTFPTHQGGVSTTESITMISRYAIPPFRLRDASWSRSSDGENRHQERLQTLPSPSHSWPGVTTVSPPPTLPLTALFFL